MDKRYIKLNGELVEIVSMEVADSKFATINSPIFTGSGTIESTNATDDKSIVNIGHLKKELSNVDTRYDEVNEPTEIFTTTLDEISNISSVKTTTGELTSISLNPDSVTSYPGLVDDENRVDNSRAGIIAIEGVKLLIGSMNGSGGINDSIENINNELTSIRNEIKTEIQNVNDTINNSINGINTSFQSKIDQLQNSIDSVNTSLQDNVSSINTSISEINTAIQDIKTQLETDLSEIRAAIELLNTKLTTLELGNNNETTRSKKSR